MKNKNLKSKFSALQSSSSVDFESLNDALAGHIKGGSLNSGSNGSGCNNSGCNGSCGGGGTTGTISGTITIP